MTKIIIVSIIVLLGIFFGITARYIMMQQIEYNENNNLNAGLIHGTLHILVKDKDGNIKYNVSKPMDSPTLWFARLLALALSNPGQVTTTVNGTSGANITIGIGGGAASYEYDFIAIGNNAQYGRIIVKFGNGTNPSYSVTKYNLDSVVAQTRGNTMVTIGADNKIHLYISGSTSIGANINITEVGVTYAFDKYDAVDNNYGETLIIYDTLSTPISLSPSDTISITYDISIG